VQKGGQALTIAIYPGNFDPITNGHLDIITRAAKLFERLIVGVYNTPNKHFLFTIEERVELARQAVAHLHNVEVQSFSGLTVDFAAKVKAQAMVRELRMSADFKQEFEMGMMNKTLYLELELVYLMSSPNYQFLSSSLLKEVASLGGSIDDLVSKHVAEALKGRLKKKQYSYMAGSARGN
jgi:pantetheine-phosphate adenylyltransferase